MTETQQLIGQVRAKLGGATDYRIAQVLDIPRQRVSTYTKGEQQADAYACAKIAEVLERDPLEIIAQVEAEAARTEKKRAFWRSFPSGLKRTALGAGWLVITAISGGGWQAGNAEAGQGSTSHNGRLRNSRLTNFSRTVQEWTQNIGFWRGLSGCCGH